MSYLITRSHEICAGHRVVGHEGKCRNIHGHGYVVTFTCTADGLDRLGRVIDFSVVKERLCLWLEANWDHRLLLWEHDPLLPPLRRLDEQVVATSFNPTAENIAAFLVESVGPVQLYGTGVRLIRCTVQETIKCGATYEAA